MPNIRILVLLALAGALSTPAKENPDYGPVAERLDAEGEFFLFLSTRQAIREVEALLDRVAAMVGGQDGERAKLGAGLVERAGADSGLLNLAAVGASRKRLEDGTRRNRIFLKRGEGGGLLWDLFPSEAREPMQLHLLPETTAWAKWGRARPKRLLGFLRKLAEGTPAEPGLAQGMERFKPMVDFERVLASIDGDWGLGITLHPTRTVPLPGAPPDVTIPEPGLVAVLPQADAYLLDSLRKLLEGQEIPFEESAIGEGRQIVVEAPPQTPFPVTPTFVHADGLLVAGSSPELVQGVLARRAAGPGGGLAAQPAFLELAAPDIATVAHLTYVSPAVATLSRQLQDHLAPKPGASPRPSPASALRTLFGPSGDDPAFAALLTLRSDPDGLLVTTRQRGSEQALLSAFALPVLFPAIGQARGRAHLARAMAGGRQIHIAVMVADLDGGEVGFPTSKDEYKSSTDYFRQLATSDVLDGTFQLFAGPGDAPFEGDDPADFGPAHNGWSVVLDVDVDGAENPTDTPFLIGEDVRIATLGDDWVAGLDPAVGKVLVVFMDGHVEALDRAGLAGIAKRIPDDLRQKNVLRP